MFCTDPQLPQAGIEEVFAGSLAGGSTQGMSSRASWPITGPEFSDMLRKCSGDFGFADMFCTGIGCGGCRMLPTSRKLGFRGGVAEACMLLGEFCVMRVLLSDS